MYFSPIISISRETGWAKLVPAEKYEVPVSSRMIQKSFTRI